MKNELKGFHKIDIFLYEEKEFIIRRKIYFFYLIPYWVKQYKIKTFGDWLDKKETVK